MLSGFTSRWIQPLAFMYAIAVAACLKMLWARSLMKSYCFWISRVFKLPAGKYSMTK